MAKAALIQSFMDERMTLSLLLLFLLLLGLKILG